MFAPRSTLLSPHIPHSWTKSTHNAPQPEHCQAALYSNDRHTCPFISCRQFSASSITAWYIQQLPPGTTMFQELSIIINEAAFVSALVGKKLGTHNCSRIDFSLGMLRIVGRTDTCNGVSLRFPVRSAATWFLTAGSPSYQLNACAVFVLKVMPPMTNHSLRFF